jgi:hypothetical protein
MKSLISLVLSLLCTTSYAENVLVDRSVNLGTKQVGKDAHIGSIVIDGAVVRNTQRGPSSAGPVKEAEQKIAVEVEEAKQRILHSLERLNRR